MRKLCFDDKLETSKKRRHLNIIEAPGKLVILFDGVTIPGIIRVVSENYIQKYNDFYPSWEVYLENGFNHIIWEQDLETGQWLTSTIWETADIEVKNHGFLTPTKKVIRTLFPNIAIELDQEEKIWKSYSTNKCLKLLIEKQAILNDEVQLLSKIKGQEELKNIEKENIERREKFELIKNQKLSFEELKIQLYD